MNVTFDGAIYSIQRFGGISRYFNALLEYLPNDIQGTLLVPNDWSSQLRSQAVKAVSCCSKNWSKSLQSVQRLLERPIVEFRDRAIQADLIHWSYYYGLRRRPIRSSPRRRNVVTVYDMIHDLFPESDARGREVVWKCNAIRCADLILCISETTRQDLIRLYPHCESKTKTVFLGNPLEGIAQGDLPSGLTSRGYILFVGGRGGYKNFGVVAKAWRRFQLRYPEIKLAIVGSPMKVEEIEACGLTGNQESLVHLGNVDDQQLVALYRNCIAFAFPSRYEGFGLPVVESQSCGALLLTSGGGSLKEIAGEGALFFPPDDDDALTLLFEEALEGSERCSRAKELGQLRASNFTWSRTAESTFAAYRELLS